MEAFGLAGRILLDEEDFGDPYRAAVRLNGRP